MMSFSQCASTPKLEKRAPLELGNVYFNEWVAGARYGGSGINLFIPVQSSLNNIQLDTVYFRGKQAKLEHINDTLFVGRFETYKNKPQDIIMSNEPYGEYGNNAPKIPEKIPFELKEDECVVSYKNASKTKFFKITNIVKKQNEETLFPASKPQ